MKSLLLAVMIGQKKYIFKVHNDSFRKSYLCLYEIEKNKKRDSVRSSYTN